MANIAIRKAREDEGEVLTALSMRAKQSNGYDDAFMARCRDELAVTATRLAADEYWVAESDRVCGCASLSVRPDGKTAQIHSFFVEPDFHGMGVGKMLWSKLRDRAEALSLDSLCLDADPNAEPFYIKMGFSRIGEVASGSIAGRTIPHMKLDLKVVQ